MADPTDEHYAAADDVLTGSLGAGFPAATAKETPRQYLIRLLTNRDVAILIVAIILFALFSVIGTRFLSETNLIDIARRAAIFGILAVGMTYLFAAGELDLSIGSHFSFLLVLISIQNERYGIDPWVASGLVILLGFAIGTLNGWLVTWIGLPSFIVTLGMLALLRGASNTLSSGYPLPAGDTDQAFYNIIRADFIGTSVPNIFVAMVIVMVIGGIVLAKTKFGSDAYSTGGNVEAARDNGVNTKRVKVISFAMMGGLCGLSAALLFGRIAQAPVSAGVNLELNVIAAVIVGGAALYGGRGTIFGSLMGVLILSMMTSVIIRSGINALWDGVAAGAIILVAASVDIVLRRAAARRLVAVGE